MWDGDRDVGAWGEYRRWRKGREGSWQEEYGRILGEDGEGEMWMRKVDEERMRGVRK